MIENGKVQVLNIVEETEKFIILSDEENLKKVFLDKSELDADDRPESLKVFVYFDDDRYNATLQMPYAEAGHVAYLKVSENTKIGAFLDLGIKKELFLPFKCQTQAPIEGVKYWVGLYTDKENRLCSTMNIDGFLSCDSPYKEKDFVDGIVYSYEEDYGYFVAVSNRYHGLILKNECFKEYKLGEKVNLRVVEVREDGKLNLSPRNFKSLELDADLTKIIRDMKNNDGVLSISDKADSDTVKATFNISKKAFKRAISELLFYKKLIVRTDTGYKLIDGFDEKA